MIEFAGTPPLLLIMIRKKCNTVEVVPFASTKEEEVNAKTVKVVVFASTRDKEVNAKTVTQHSKSSKSSKSRRKKDHLRTA